MSFNVLSDNQVKAIYLLPTIVNSQVILRRIPSGGGPFFMRG